MRYLLFVVIILVSGCSSKNSFTVHEYTKRDAPAYPRVSVLINDGYVYSSGGCSHTGCYGYVDKSPFYIIDELRNSGLFDGVISNNANEKYKLYVKFDRETRGTDGGDYAKLLFSISTAMLFPVTYEYTYYAEFIFVDEGQSLGVFSYSLESSEVSQLFTETDLDKKKAIESIVSNFLLDFEKSGLIRGI